MRFAIISDTHGNVANFKKAIIWLNKEGISLILHCGDIGSPESFKESIADFKGEIFGVLGNTYKDSKIELVNYQGPKTKILEEFVEITIKEKRIAIIHRPDTTRELAEFGKYDMVFYGHTHKPWEEKIRGCRVINPGELAGQYFKPTFAVYDTDRDSLKLKILETLDKI